MAASEIVLATGNAGKRREIEALLAGLPVTLRMQSEFAIGEADETGLTFVENAIIKARHASLATGLPAIADDSGLEVEALSGRPGVRSARFAGPDATDADNVAQLLAEMAAYPDEHQRNAAFRCVVVYLRFAEDPAPIIAEGRWDGRIALHADGDGGFGYDPVFFVPAAAMTAASMPRDEKNKVSHRAQALASMRPALAALLR